MLANFSIPNLVFALITIVGGSLATHNLAHERNTEPNSYAASGQDCMSFLFGNCVYAVGGNCTSGNETASITDWSITSFDQNRTQYNEKGDFDGCYASRGARVVDCGTINLSCPDGRVSCTSHTKRCWRK